MRTVPGSAARRILREHGAEGWSELARRFGRTYRVAGAVITSDPVVARAILLERANTETRPITYRLIDRLLPGGAGILWKQGDDWRLRLRALMPSLTPARLDSLADEIAAISTAELTALRPGEEGGDLAEVVTALGLRTVMQIGYNLDLDEARAREFGEALIRYKHTLIRPDARYRADQLGTSPAHFPWILLGMLELRRQTRRIEALVDGLVEKPPLFDRSREGWLQLLRQGGLRGRELAAELNHLYSAYDAIDFVIVSALVCLDRRPDWADLMRPELEGIAAEPKLRRGAIEHTPHTRAFIQEVLRCFPVSMLVARQTATPIETAELTIRAGSLVTLAMYPLHRDPARWPDPDRFLPERWMDDVDEPEPGVFVPFLVGPRKCIGQGLAELQILSVLLTLRDRRIRIRTDGARVDHFAVPRWDRKLAFRVESATAARALTA